MARIQVELQNAHHPHERMWDGLFKVSVDDDGIHHLYVCFGHQASIDTNRESIVKLRDSLNELLGESKDES